MGLVFENITIKNAGDVRDARRGIIGVPDIHQIDVRAIVDTGAEFIVISEDIRQKLQLDILGNKKVTLANDDPKICQLTEPVIVQWKDRDTVVQALVLDGASEVLLGAIPLEGMNLMVDPVNQRLIGVNGDEIIYKIK